MMALLPFVVSEATSLLCTSKDALCLKLWLLSSLGILFLLLSPSVDLGCYLLERIEFRVYDWDYSVCVFEKTAFVEE